MLAILCLLLPFFKTPMMFEEFIPRWMISDKLWLTCACSSSFLHLGISSVLCVHSRFYFSEFSSLCWRTGVSCCKIKRVIMWCVNENISTNSYTVPLKFILNFFLFQDLNEIHPLVQWTCADDLIWIRVLDSCWELQKVHCNCSLASLYTIHGNLDSQDGHRVLRARKL